MEMRGGRCLGAYWFARLHAKGRSVTAFESWSAERKGAAGQGPAGRADGHPVSHTDRRTDRWTSITASPVHLLEASNHLNRSTIYPITKT